MVFSSSSQQMSDPDLTVSTVATVNSANAQRVLQTLTVAFADDPACRWLYPEEDQYLRHFPTFAMAFGGAAIYHRKVRTRPNGSIESMAASPLK